MKKIIAAVLFLFGVCFAQEDLYTIHNTSTKSIISVVENELINQSYMIVKTNPYFAQNSKNPQDSITIILQNSGDDIIYYFNSTTDKKVNKNILKTLKENNISYTKNEDTDYINVFERLSKDVVLNTQKTYTFENPAPKAIWEDSQETEDDSVLKGTIIQVLKGTTFNVYLQTPINTATASLGDNITAVSDLSERAVKTCRGEFQLKIFS